MGNFQKHVVITSNEPKEVVRVDINNRDCLIDIFEQDDGTLMEIKLPYISIECLFESKPAPAEIMKTLLDNDQITCDKMYIEDGSGEDDDDEEVGSASDSSDGGW